MTKAEKIRNEKMARYIANAENDCGAWGRVFELECANTYSRKTRVSKQGETDTYIRFEKGYYKAECKTNGGRIESLYAKNAPKFVIYRMDFMQKHKAGKTAKAWDEVRTVDAVVVPTSVFLNALERFNAIKSTNGRNPERAIQVSSKKFYEWLCDYPITYIKNYHYTADDFDGLE